MVVFGAWQQLGVSKWFNKFWVCNFFNKDYVHSSYIPSGHFVWMYTHFFLVKIHRCSPCVKQAWIIHWKAATSFVQPCWWCEMQQQAVKLRGWSVKGVGIAMGRSLGAVGWRIATVENVIKSLCFRLFSLFFSRPQAHRLQCILSDTLITAFKSPIGACTAGNFEISL